MRSSIRLFRVRGVEIGVNWSWLLVFALVTWSLGAALFPATYPGLSTRTYLVMAIVASVLFFGSVLLHELAHAFVGIREGVRIEGITLWLLGGVARFSGTPGSPGGEFRMTIVGPLTSFVVGGAFLGLAFVAHAAGWPEPVRGVADYLGRINLILGAFNMVPAFPLDGGRVLRSWLWRRQESFVAATTSAARAGRAFGWMLIVIALLGLWSGEGVGGVWFALLGWFLLQASRAEAGSAVVHAAFRGRRVADVMTPEPETLDADTPLERFLDLATAPRGHSTYPVVEDGLLVGAVSVRLAAAVDPAERPARRVRDVMIPAERLRTTDAGEPVTDVLPDLQEQGRLFVVDDGRIDGILSAADVARAIEARRIRGERERPRRGAGILVWVVVAALMLGVAGYLYHPPLAVIEPSAPIDITNDVAITGLPTDRVDGRYLATPVRISRPSALAAVVAAFDPNRELVSLGSVFPADVSPGQLEQRQREAFAESQMVAAAAAARAAEMSVSVSGSGARVVDVVDGSPADGVVRPGDVIVAIDGRPVQTADDLRASLSSSPPGTPFRLDVERGNARLSVKVSTARVTDRTGSFVGLGVLLETRGLSIDLPFRVSFRHRAVGGESAGLAYALLVADMLLPEDVAGGRDVAATGTVDIEGDVGPIGGLASKVESARAGGADVFLVPSGEVGGIDPDGVRVRGVASVEDAIDVLGRA